MFSERKPKKEQKAQQEQTDVGEQLSHTSLAQSLLNASICPGWPDMVAGHGESRVAHGHPIPKPTSAEPLGSSLSLLVNKVTSSLPGIAL